MLKITSRGGILYVVGSVNGNRVRQSTGLSVGNKAEAELVRANMELALFRGDSLCGGVGAKSFKSVCESYEKRRGGISKTQKGNIDRLLRYWGSTHVDDINQFLVDRYVADVHCNNKDGTIRRELNTMKAILNYGAERGLCKEARFGLPPDGEGRTRYLSSDERSKVLACLGGIEELSDKVSPIKRELIFLLYCGARLSEMRTLLWGAVDEDSVVLVSIKGNKRKKKTRRVPLHHRVVNTLGVRGEPTELVFTKGGGNMWDKTAFYHEFHKVMSCAGISDFTPHDCRHTFASHLVMGGADLRTVAELLGHSTMSMVMRYSHLSRGHLEDAIKKL